MSKVLERHTVKVICKDGYYWITDINGTKEEIERYFLCNRFVRDDETTFDYPVKVEFLA